MAPAPKPDFQPTDRPVSRKTGVPQSTPRDRTAHGSAPPRLPLHSGSQVSSLLGIEWCDQNGVEFSAKGLRTQRRSRRKTAGASPTIMFAGDNSADRGISGDREKTMPAGRPRWWRPGTGALRRPEENCRSGQGKPLLPKSVWDKRFAGLSCQVAILARAFKGEL